ncbi:MAG: TetR family transcriptional regulator C-terminal domain-containing protein [Spirochaetales bacterium]|nr:TetR family transcriptional regulator C-terminal domain-containing protein [Spirochaetales bacterium]
MSPRSLAEIRRQEIMEHFYAVVSEEGFDGASLAKVANRMGVNPSLLLHYFGSRDQMVMEFVDFIISRYEKVYIDILKDITDPAEKLEILMDRFFARDWAELVGDRAFYECYALSLSHPDIKKRFTTFYRKFRDTLAVELSGLIGKGFLPEIDPGRAADFLIVMMEGKDFYNNIAPDQEDFASIRKHLKSITYTVLTGKTYIEKEE